MRRKSPAKATPKRAARTRKFAAQGAVTPYIPNIPNSVGLDQLLQQEWGSQPADPTATDGTQTGATDPTALSNQMNAVNPTAPATNLGGPPAAPAAPAAPVAGGGGMRRAPAAAPVADPLTPQQHAQRAQDFARKAQMFQARAQQANQQAQASLATYRQASQQAQNASAPANMQSLLTTPPNAGDTANAIARRRAIDVGNAPGATGYQKSRAKIAADPNAVFYGDETPQVTPRAPVTARNLTPAQMYGSRKGGAIGLKKGGKVRKRKFDDGGGVDTDSGDNTPLDVSSAASASLGSAAPSLSATSPDLDSMSFGQAFRAARNRPDDPGTFTWHGKKFSTDLASDKPKAKPKASSSSSTPTPTPKAAPPQMSDAARALSMALPRTAQLAPPPPTVGRATGQVTNDPYAAGTAAYLKSIGAGPGYPARVGMSKGGGVKKMAKGGGSNPFGGNQAPPFGAKGTTPPAPPKAKGPPKPPPFTAKAGPASVGGGKTPPASKPTPPAGSASPPPSSTADDMFRRGGKAKKMAKGGASLIKSNPFAKGPPAATPAEQPNPFAKTSRFPSGKAREVPREFGKASPFQETSLSAKGGKLKKKKKMAKGGGVARFAKGGGIDGCAIRGHTRAKRSK